MRDLELKIKNFIDEINSETLNILKLGNIYAIRDWGHAKDYVEMQWKILQQKKPDDYVIATGKQLSIRQFVNIVSKKLSMKIKYQ